MLNSVREIFDLVGIDFETTSLIPQKFDTQKSIIDAITNKKKYPAIVGGKFDLSSGTVYAHAMVATGVKTEHVLIGSSVKQQHFIQCKSSDREDPNQPGKFHRRYPEQVMYRGDQICLQYQ